MRVIIAGSRTIFNYDLVKEAIKESGFKIKVILCGCANGVDKLGEQYATDHGIMIEYYEADWKKYGKLAGFVRNDIMADNADALIAIWDNKSRGTMHMIQSARINNLKVYIKNG